MPRYEVTVHYADEDPDDPRVIEAPTEARARRIVRDELRAAGRAWSAIVCVERRSRSGPSLSEGRRRELGREMVQARCPLGTNEVLDGLARRCGCTRGEALARALREAVERSAGVDQRG